MRDSMSTAKTAIHGRAPAEMLKESVGKVGMLPTLPKAAAKAMAAANDPSQSLRQLARVVEGDPAMAAALLRLANSPLYRIGKSVDSLEQAVVRLGLRESKNLIVAVSLRSIFAKGSRTNRGVLEALWRHSFITGALCRHLNQQIGLGFQGEEFTCGLAHDLGRVLFAIILQDQFRAADPLDFHEDGDVLAHEQKVLGTDHCAFGAWFAAGQQLPSSVGSVIACHHAPMEAQSHQMLVSLVATADHMANYVQRQRTPRGYDIGANPGWNLMARELDDDKQAGVERRALELMAQADKESQAVLSF